MSIHLSAQHFIVSLRICVRTLYAVAFGNCFWRIKDEMRWRISSFWSPICRSCLFSPPLSSTRRSRSTGMNCAEVTECCGWLARLPDAWARFALGFVAHFPAVVQMSRPVHAMGNDPREFAHSVNDTIRDAILTCARKPTWVSLIYRTETTTKRCKTEKLKRETDKLNATAAFSLFEYIGQTRGHDGRSVNGALGLWWRRFHSPNWSCFTSRGSESVPIQLAQCWFSGLAISNAKTQIYFSSKMDGSNFIKQHSETVTVWNQATADCS